ncbi:MAG TPA: hypothetical protein VGL22_11350 [Terracidiphilus sp.]|jgi:hypothetical protein
MKRWQVIALTAAVIAAGAYLYYYRGFRFGGLHFGSGDKGGGSSESRGAAIQWQSLTRPDVGFRVDMPPDAKETQVPAYNEAGGSEPITMLYSSPDSDTVFAITWADNPPVSRVNHRLPELTLDQARDGMLARTRTTLMRESKNPANGYPSRDITARNSEGGILDARFLLIGDRLYTLMALYPSSNARREQDVTRFYNSFTALHPDTTLPPA